MGLYVNETTNGNIGTSFKEKCSAIEADGGIKIDPPTEFKDNLVVIVKNPYFAACAYAYNKKEMNRFITGRGDRIWQWYVWHKVTDFAA